MFVFFFLSSVHLYSFSSVFFFLFVFIHSHLFFSFSSLHLYSFSSMFIFLSVHINIFYSFSSFFFSSLHLYSFSSGFLFSLRFSCSFGTSGFMKKTHESLLFSPRWSHVPYILGGEFVYVEAIVRTCLLWLHQFYRVNYWARTYEVIMNKVWWRMSILSQII